MNKDSRVKDKLTGEIIDKSLSLSVKPRGKSRFIYFKNKERGKHLEYQFICRVLFTNLRQI